MATVVKVEGFEAFQAKVAELSKTGGDIFVMFSGSKDANGVSWCPDCVDAEPVVNGCLSGAADDSHYLYVGVGGRSFWKDQNCVFRTAKETQLKSVPTLIKWGTKQRLEEGQCADKNLVGMMFEE
eukprot:TRINITY_DN2072_c0_g1_i1.p1 TRINITY_DN2072_c0_g1~~TRINITY_DN2072_c0_g1_i1.p1  ORF type:complete len:125 (+),score=33.95 TRINITY_DN2072_c0_g1_i1:125-499(+)